MRGLAVYLIITFLALNIIQAYVVSAYVLDRSSKVTIVAVSSLPNGTYVGVTAGLHTRVVCPGSGHVFVETLPLTQIDLQASTRIAALVASRVAGIDFTSCDYYVSIRSESPIVGGPSASAVTSAAFAASLLGIPISSEVIMTGMIMPDGSIGPVGGLKAKLEAAARVGAKKFLVPYGQVYDVDYVVVEERRGGIIIYRTQQVVVDLVEYGRKLGIEVVPVANIYDALEILSNGFFRAPRSDEGLEVISRLESMANPIFAEWVGVISSEVLKCINEGSTVKNEVLRTLSGVSAVNIRNLLNNIESYINNTLLRASTLESQKMLYAASSAYFQALIYAKWRYHLLKALLNDKYLITESARVNASVGSIISEARSLVSDYVDLGVISVLANVLERAYDALIYLNNSLNSQDLPTSTYYLGLADARLFTARLWFNMSKYVLVGESVSTKDLNDMVVNIESLIQNIYTYILAFSGSTAIRSNAFNDAYTRYSLMQSLSNDLDKFAVGLSSLGYMYLTLTSMFTNNYTTLAEALNKTILVTLSMLNTTTPLDAVAYMELARAYATDPGYQAYMLARLSMLLSTYLSLRYVGRVLPQQTAIPPQYCEVVVTKTVTVTNTQVVTEVVSKTLAHQTNVTSDLITSTMALILIVLVVVLLFDIKTLGKIE
ncbi:MAG: S16 family serine protease [Sulfolobales archaeon]